MTPIEQWNAMTPREQNKEIAKICGFSIYHYDKDVPERCYYMLVDENFDPVANDNPWSWHNGERKTEEEAWNDCPDFVNDISAAMEAEGKIMQMKLSVQNSYLENLETVVRSKLIDDNMTLKSIVMFKFHLIHASAADRCKAMYLTLNQNNERR